MVEYKIKDIYQGGYSTFKPTPLIKGNYPISTGSLGMTTDPRNANVLQEVSQKLSSGVKQIEIEAVTPDYFDNVAKQHLTEVKRLADLTGINVSVHGPVMNTSGLGQQGFSESERVLAERKVLQTLERSHEINPQGNILVNFHSSEGVPGSQYDMTKEGLVPKRLVAVNKESGRMIPLEEDKKYYPGGEGGKIREETHNPLKNLKIANSTEWDNSLTQIEFNRERAETVLKDVHPIFRELYIHWRLAQSDPKQVPEHIMYQINNLSRDEHEQIRKIHTAAAYMSEAMKGANSAFSKAYEFGSDEDKNHLKELSKVYSNLLSADKDHKKSLQYFDPKTQSEAVFALLNGLERVTPEIYVPVDDFAMEKSSTTYGNAAFQSYKKFKDSAPILVIENPPGGFALSTGEDIANIVKKSREQFVKQAIKDGVSERDAEKQAEKLIGATWDVGHINMLRRFGYSEEDIVKESEKVAPFIKHVHLSDNFGFEHTELPMGMGNVPFKQIMEKLGQKGYDSAKIIEASAWWTHFKENPLLTSLEYMGSPIYSSRVSPYWNQNLGLRQDYFGGYGSFLPQINYEMFGAGFSSLPSELGGQRPGAGGSRMSGRQME